MTIKLLLEFLLIIITRKKVGSNSLYRPLIALEPKMQIRGQKTHFIFYRQIPIIVFFRPKVQNSYNELNPKLLFYKNRAKIYENQ